MNEPHTDLEVSILKTLCWFSLFFHPLTTFEIWKWLLEPKRSYDLAQVQSALRNSAWLGEKLQSENGFFALQDSSSLRNQQKLRRVRFSDAEEKFSKLKRVARFFSFMPAVRAVAVGNTLAWWMTQKKSDIDLYIITKSGNIWSSRFWLVLPFVLLHRRPETRHKESDESHHTFCFSFFSTQDALQLQELCVQRDYYMAFWVKSLVPIFDRDGSLEHVHRLNRWASVLLPNAKERALHQRHKPLLLPSIMPQPTWLEPFWRSMQLRRLPLSLRNLANKDTRVVVNDNTLKFHDNDRREQFRDQFEALLARHV